MMQNINRSTSFDDYGAEPSPLLWEKIEKRLPAPSGKKRGWFFWSAAALLLTGVFIASNFFDIEIKPKHTEPKQNSAVATKNKSNDEGNKITAQENTVTAIWKATENNSSGQQSVPENVYSKNEKKPAGKEKSSLVSVKTKITKAETVSTEKSKPVPAEKAKTTSGNVTHEDRMPEEIIPEKIFALVPVPDYLPESLPSPVIDFGGMKKKNSASRWQLSLLSGWNYNYRVLDFTSSGSSTISDAEKNYLSGNEEGINTVSLEAGIGYNISTHFSLLIGVNYFSEGQERNQSEVILTSGNPGTSSTVYSVNTSAGILSGSGELFDNTFYNNTDSTVFPPPPSALGAPVPYVNTSTKDFAITQEFTFIGVPLLLQYQFTEHRFTPYFGLGFSAGYIVNEKVSFNDEPINYVYSTSINRLIFFAEAQAGVKYFLSNHFSLKLQPTLRYGLNSINRNKTAEWIPYSAGIGAGINFRF